LNQATKDTKSSKDAWQQHLDKGKDRKRRDTTEDGFKYQENLFDDYELNKSRQAYKLKRQREDKPQNMIKV